MGDGCVSMDCASGAAPAANQRVRGDQKKVGRGADLWLAHGLPPISKRL